MAPKLKKGTKVTTSGITRVEVLSRHTPSPDNVFRHSEVYSGVSEGMFLISAYIIQQLFNWLILMAKPLSSATNLFRAKCECSNQTIYRKESYKSLHVACTPAI